MKGNTKPKQDERLLTYAEVCDVLQTSQATLRRYVRDGRFPPPIKPNPNGRSVRFRYSDIAAWLSDL
ncbi:MULTISPECIES: helix-turn-helix transcriptional regulator [Gammaproteobacteria]|uniref:helix-turn-helix transcriptional regulator n=1 Tax=Gammaproteobacteria TaxID=1236 RepID=UPI0011D4B7A4|nr:MULTISPECIES: helix-turn-helix domain-containing protein [Gammaproteobacteria]EGQ9417708.1 helix-turn-helix domain-containing protein [Vibrio cholerae]EJL9433349.1 helix-turn-helix domain-containing protein [Vibrio cholerae]MCU4228933.1 helix-turn-helix domain-containing protein [Vibrio cholerae]MEB2719855.1 helix-turn-helix domain-containing protein [Citrobacter portucalensis]TXX93025.1 helix-turn-helix domain-containing protein [Vibrio cholerae]